MPYAAADDEDDYKDFQSALQTGTGERAGFAWSDQVNVVTLDKEPAEGEQEDEEEVSEAHRLKSFLNTDPLEGFNALQEASKIQPSTGQQRVAVQREIVHQVDTALNERPVEVLDSNEGREDF